MPDCHTIPMSYNASLLYCNIVLIPLMELRRLRAAISCLALSLSLISPSIRSVNLFVFIGRFGRVMI